MVEVANSMQRHGTEGLSERCRWWTDRNRSGGIRNRHLLKNSWIRHYPNSALAEDYYDT